MKDFLQNLVIVVLLIPLLAIFLGAGVLAFQVGETWQEADTRALISGVTASCAGGAFVLALIFGLVVGVPLALRAYSAGAYSSKRWDDPREVPPDYRRALPSPGQQRAPWAEQPPQVHTGQQVQGEWLSRGPADYDVIDGEWT